MRSTAIKNAICIMSGMETAVIIPTVDRPALLERAVLSALRQDTPFSQIIIVNDSPDYAAFCDQVIFNATIASPLLTTASTSGREGLPAARALGLANLLPNIKAVCYLDDDDELLPNHVSSLLKPLTEGAAFAFSKALFRYQDGSETEDPEPGNHGPKRYYDPNALLQQNIAPVSSFIHTVEALNKIGGWDRTLIRMEDWDFWARMYIYYGAPTFVNAVTNVIYKGTQGNLTDSSEFSYSMACSWRDIVSDRIKAMAAETRYNVTEDDLKKFHIPKVGVVMPAYNAEKYLRPAVESILAQTYTDWELIAVNDGSTDSSRKILESYLYDKRIRIFDMPENSGVTKTLNRGLLLSRSEYIARMDADDISSKDRFARQVEYLDRHRNIMVVGTNFDSMNEDMTKCIWANDLPQKPEDVREALLKYCCIGHPTVMMRRRIIEMVGGYSLAPEYKAVEDYELWLRISQKHQIANIGTSLLTYRNHTDQVSHQFADIQKTNARRVRTKYRMLAGDMGEKYDPQN